MSESSFLQYMRSLGGPSIHLEVLKGNNGDQLIWMGIAEVLRKTGLHAGRTPHDADLILINGGGAMNDLWPEGAAQVLEALIGVAPDKDIVVGPSSYWFRKLDFPAILRKSSGRITLFCRERRSEEFLRSLDLPPQVTVMLSQDLAFELRDSEFLREQLSLAQDRQVLCAMRKDCEGEAGVFARTRASWLPAPIRKPLSWLRDRLVANRSADRLTPILRSISPRPAASEIVYRDISVSLDFHGFCREVRNSRAVITNRLHVGILGSLLGKRVHLLRGAYHKIDGVYEYSLSENSAVSLH
jgi:exopolysaccharide biosynthesis predicted pyruvyltransferase EpsI